jgi:5-formyltetrahydrofolate cyclo-ligase
LAQSFVHFDPKRMQMKCEFSPGPHPEKESMRRSVRAKLRAMTPAFRAEASLVICELAARLPAFVRAKCVALFSPLPSEPDIHPLIEEAWAHRKRVVLPRMVPGGSHPRLEWHEVTDWGEVIEPGPFGLREPDPSRCAQVDLRALACAFIPGVAFDRDGFRLGRGGGFYDCFLAQAPPTVSCVGLMFSCQEAPRVPREPHDQALPGVISENGLVIFSKPSS